VKKIPTLLDRDWANRPKLVLPKWGPGMPPPDADMLVPTIKRDGTACAIIGGRFYRRHDCKAGSKWAKHVPADWIACQEPDPKGHWPHWVPVGNGPEDQYHRAARAAIDDLSDGTYELCGPHFQTNPHGLTTDCLFPHGTEPLFAVPPIDGDPADLHAALRVYLAGIVIEGIVWWTRGNDRVPVCKIKRSDFDLPWPEGDR
jgi:hypothetical protein